MDITCTKCGHEFELSEQLATPLVKETEKKYEELLRCKDADLQKQKEELETTKISVEQEVEKRLTKETEKIAKVEAEKAKAMAQTEIKDKVSEIDLLKAQLLQNDEKLEDARKQQLGFMQKERELEDKRKELDIELEKRLREKSLTLETKLRDNISQELSLKVQEKDDTIEAMRKKIEGLKQRAEQGSQQAQGESLEVVLETKLREAFPFDTISPVAKGVSGADILQEVMGPSGKIVGSILWETKRTKTWHATWLPKLREDQRRAGANLSVLMSMTMPQEIKNFGQIDNVWVSSFDCAISLVTSLRINLIELANLRIIRKGESSKKELIYEYLTGPEFARRVEAIVERFSEAQTDLLKEKTWMQKMWARREKQIQGVISSTAGMYGDLEGLAGKSMPNIESLSAPLLGEG